MKNERIWCLLFHFTLFLRDNLCLLPLLLLLHATTRAAATTTASLLSQSIESESICCWKLNYTRLHYFVTFGSLSLSLFLAGALTSSSPLASVVFFPLSLCFHEKPWMRQLLDQITWLHCKLTSMDCTQYFMLYDILVFSSSFLSFFFLFFSASSSFSYHKSILLSLLLRFHWFPCSRCICVSAARVKVDREMDTLSLSKYKKQMVKVKERKSDDVTGLSFIHSRQLDLLLRFSLSPLSPIERVSSH